MTIKELKAKHKLLKKIDGGHFFKKGTFKIFGSSTHGYQLNPCLTLKTLKDFENHHAIILPSQYKSFLSEIGNGDSGPAYGLFALLDWAYDLVIKEDVFLSTPFPFINEWNNRYSPESDTVDYTLTQEYQNWEADYFSNKHVTGSMRICHYGCAIYYLLIVTGKEAGNVWIDDRANDGGIYPALSKTTGLRLNFIDWYNEWLNESLEDMQ